MLVNAIAATGGIVRSGQLAGTRNHAANFSRLVTENVLPARKRLKNAPLLTTIVAIRDNDLPPRRATSAS